MGTLQGHLKEMGGGVGGQAADVRAALLPPALPVPGSLPCLGGSEGGKLVWREIRILPFPFSSLFLSWH